MTKVVCFSKEYLNQPSIVSDSINEAFSAYKNMVDGWVSLDDVMFIEIPDDLPQVKYKQVLVPAN